jgi:hypothetical protein
VVSKLFSIIISDDDTTNSKQKMEVNLLAKPMLFNNQRNASLIVYSFKGNYLCSFKIPFYS